MRATLVNHLLQSTVFAVVAGILTLLLRDNHARTRYWIWLTASLKFLVPFSIFVEIGHRLNWSGRLVITQPRVAYAIDQIGRQFYAPDLSSVPVRAASGPPLLPSLLATAWVAGSVVILAFWLMRWSRVATIVRHAQRTSADARPAVRLTRIAGLENPIELISSATQMEPGVFGLWRQRIVLPADIEEHLDDAQLDAVLAHELCHIRRRDNLTAAIHMLVEAVFWFHPLVWWIGTKLVDERERACYEKVVQMGSDPELYAGTILQICKLYLASPLVCTAGISGSSLSKRIEGVMKNPFLKNLGVGKKLALAVVGLVALSTPIAIGIFGAQATRAQTPAVLVLPAAPQPQVIAQAPPARKAPAPAQRPEFESATVQPESPGVKNWQIVGGPVRATRRRSCIRALPAEASGQGLPGVDAITGPDWLDTEQFYIVANISSTTDLAQSTLMLRNLLTDRFHLTLHRETQRFSGYALIIADAGPGEMGRLWKMAMSFQPEGQLPVLGPGANGRTPLAYTAVWLPGMDSETAGLDMTSPHPRLIDRTGMPSAYSTLINLLPALGRLMNTSPLLFDKSHGEGTKIERVTNVPLYVLVVDRATPVTAPK